MKRRARDDSPAERSAKAIKLEVKEGGSMESDVAEGVQGAHSDEQHAVEGAQTDEQGAAAGDTEGVVTGEAVKCQQGEHAQL